MMRFSISVPVGAWHDLLPTCLESLWRQGEGVGVALLDASGDARVAALADKFDNFIAYRRHGPDAGQSAAIAEGWANVGGEALGWLNADDFLFPGAIERARAALAAGADVAAGYSAICDAAGSMTGYHWAVAPPGENLRSGCVISQPSCFFRRDAFERAGGLDLDLHYTMDWDLWLRLLDSGARFSFIDAALSVVYWGEGTKTLGLRPQRRAELLRIIRQYTPPKDRFRAMRGFALRAMLDEMRPAAASRWIERRLRRKTPYVYGVGPRGEFAEEATIYWAHYASAPKQSVLIAAEGAENLDIASISHPGETERRAGGLLIRFANEVNAAETVSIGLVRRGGPARLISCNWC